MPFPEITNESAPADTPVIVQVAVAVLGAKGPTLNVGVETLKCPFWELRVSDTPDSVT